MNVYLIKRERSNEVYGVFLDENKARKRALELAESWRPEKAIIEFWRAGNTGHSWTEEVPQVWR